MRDIRSARLYAPWTFFVTADTRTPHGYALVSAPQRAVRAPEALILPRFAAGPARVFQSSIRGAASPAVRHEGPITASPPHRLSQKTSTVHYIRLKYNAASSSSLYTVRELWRLQPNSPPNKRCMARLARKFPSPLSFPVLAQIQHCSLFVFTLRYNFTVWQIARAFYAHPPSLRADAKALNEVGRHKKSTSTSHCEVF